MREASASFNRKLLYFFDFHSSFLIWSPFAMKIDFIDNLRKFQNIDALYEKSEATSEGILSALKDIFTDEEDVDIITPEMSSIYSINEPEGSISYMKMIEEGYLKEVDGQYRENLKRPVVAIINTSNIRQNAGKVNHDAISKHGHWQTLVIIPKEGNNVDVFFHDPLFQRKLPAFFKSLFDTPYNYEIKSDDDIHTLSTGGKFQPAFHEGRYKIQQQTGAHDCGWWSLYNAIMFVADKNDDFLGNYENFDKEIAKDNGAKLRKLFAKNHYNLTLSSVQPGSSTSSARNIKKLLFAEDKEEKIKEFLREDREEALRVMKAIDNEVSNDLENKVLEIDDHAFQLLSFLFESTNSLQKAFELLEKVQNNSMEIDQISMDLQISSPDKTRAIQEELAQLQISPLRVKKGLKFATDPDTFERVVTSDIFVDKSLFIKEIIDSSADHILITRPRRWGKTLNMDMLKTFFQPDVSDGSHYDLHDKCNKNKVLFEGGEIELDFLEKKKLKKLKIAEEGEHYLKRQGQYPVIFISFKDIKESTYDNVVTKLKSEISKTFIEHEYLYKNMLLKDIAEYNELTQEPGQKITTKGKKVSFLEKAVKMKQIQIREEAKKFKRFKDEKDSKDTQLTEQELKESLSFLSELLQEHFERKVYILVDEYEAPVTSLLEEQLKVKGKPSNIKLVDKVSKLITSVLSHCGKNNPVLEKIILTGVTDTLKKDGASGFNNIKVFDVTNEKFSNSFGFSEEEIKEQLLKNTLEQMPSKESLQKIMDKIAEKYNGYQVYQQFGEIKLLYNPWAVMSFVSELKDGSTKITFPRNDWQSSGVSSILQNLPTIRLKEELLNKLQKLVQNYEDGIQLDYDSNIEIANDLKNVLAEDNINAEQLVSYLLISSGYITNAGKAGYYKIPNKEVYNYFAKNVLNYWLKEKLGDVNPILEGFVKALKQGAVEFKKFLEEKIINNEKLADKPEAHFQGIIHGITTLASITKKINYISEVEYQALGKRIDGFFIPNQKNDESVEYIVHEYKVDNSEYYSRDSKMDEALEQIYRNNYIAPAIRQAKEGDVIITRGMVFYHSGEKGGNSLMDLQQATTKKWEVKIVEYRHDLLEAKDIYKIFSTYKNNVDTAVAEWKKNNNKSNVPTKEQKKLLDEEWKKRLEEYKVDTLSHLLDKIKQDHQKKSDSREKLFTNQDEQKTKDIEMHQNEVDISCVYRNQGKRQKIGETTDVVVQKHDEGPQHSKLYGDNKATGVIKYADGMSDKDIELNLQSIKSTIISNNRQNEFYIEEKVLNKVNIIQAIKQWNNSDDVPAQYLSILTLTNAERKKHALTLHIEKHNNILKITIADPLSCDNAEFKQEIRELRGLLSIFPGIRYKVVHTAIQDINSPTCADVSLHAILESILDSGACADLSLIGDSAVIAPECNGNAANSAINTITSINYNIQAYLPTLYTFMNERPQAQIEHANHADNGNPVSNFPTTSSTSHQTQHLPMYNVMGNNNLHVASLLNINDANLIGASFLNTLGIRSAMILVKEGIIPEEIFTVETSKGSFQKNTEKKSLYSSIQEQDDAQIGGGMLLDEQNTNKVPLSNKQYQKFKADFLTMVSEAGGLTIDVDGVLNQEEFVKKYEKKLSEYITDKKRTFAEKAISYVDKVNSFAIIVDESLKLVNLAIKDELTIKDEIYGIAGFIKIENALHSLSAGKLGLSYTFGLSVDAIADGVYFGYSAFRNNHSEFITAGSKFLTSLTYSFATSISHGATLSITAALGIPLLGKVAIVIHGTSYTTGLLKSYTYSWIGKGGYADYCVTGLDNTVKTIAQPIIFTTEVISVSIASIQGELGWLNEDTSFQNNIRGLELSKTLLDLFSWVTPKFVYDFEQGSKWYQNKIDKANELESYKRHFAKTNDQKLYDGIYKLALEKKYALINSGTSVEDAKEWMESMLKTNVTVKAPEVGDCSGDTQRYLYKYDVCFEMNSYENGKQYYCYSKSANTVDSILAGSQHDQFEVIDGCVEYKDIHFAM